MTEQETELLLAIDVGNTNIVLGVFRGAELTVSWRLATLPERTADEMWVVTSRLFDDDELDTRRITGVVLSSVVPRLTETMAEMVSRRLGHEALRIDWTNAGLPIRYENPAEVGADRLVNGVAARVLYGVSTLPVIVVDFGTATTFDGISGSGEYLGGVICPGVEISAAGASPCIVRSPVRGGSRDRRLRPGALRRCLQETGPRHRISGPALGRRAEPWDNVDARDVPSTLGQMDRPDSGPGAKVERGSAWWLVSLLLAVEHRGNLLDPEGLHAVPWSLY